MGELADCSGCALPRFWAMRAASTVAPEFEAQFELPGLVLALELCAGPLWLPKLLSEAELLFWML